jgi:flagellar hook-associated protein 3 FlgL
MRVTNKIMMDSIRASLSKNTQAIVHINEQIATGKKINRPSDDPVGMSKVLGYQNSISSVEQYITNIERGQMHLKTVEDVLDAVDYYVDMAKDIATDQSVGELETRASAAQQVKGIYDQIMQLANTKLGNTYLFSGHEVQTEPFSADPDGIEGTADDYSAQYHGDDGDLKIIIGENSQVKVNAHGEEIFTGVGVADGVNVFDVLENLINGLENTDAEAGTLEIRDQLDPLEQAQIQITNVRTQNAGTYERLETTKTYWSDFKVRLEQLLSDTQDINTEEAVIELKNQELLYETCISLAKETMDISLLGFLR